MDVRHRALRRPFLNQIAPNSSKPREFAPETASLQDVLQALLEAELRHASMCKLRSFTKRLEPLINFLDRYSKAIDVLVQGSLNPVAVAWGITRALIEVACGYTKYFPKLINMLEMLGNTLSIYSEYEKLMSDDNRVRMALDSVYTDVLSILMKAQTIFQKRGPRLFFHIAWGNFESDFQDALTSLMLHRDVVTDEATLSHRKKVHDILELTKGSLINENDLRTRIMQWLSPVDCAGDVAREAVARTPGTGTWLFNHEKFQMWRGKQSNILWIFGPPGSGKTVLSTSAIEHLQQYSSENNPLVYFLADKLDDQKRSYIALVATFLALILAQSAQIPSELLKAFHLAQTYGRTRLSDSDSPDALLRKLVSNLPAMYTIIDGLDEFKDIPRITKLLKSLTTSNPRSYILVLSRDYPSIRHSLDAILHIDLVRSPMKFDTCAYIRAEVERLMIEEMVLQEKVIRAVTDKADGSFLWASFILQELSSTSSVAQMEQTIAKLPDGLESLYSQIFQKLSRRSADSLCLSQAVFLWVCSSRRQLSWKELRCAIAQKTAGEPHSEKHLPFRPAVREACGDLVAFDEEQNTFRLVHLSVQEYLLGHNNEYSDNSMYRMHKQSAHGEIAMQCLEYLHQVKVPDGKWESDEYPLLSYATCYWCEHAIRSNFSPELHKKISSFLSDSRKRRFWLMNLLFWGPYSYPIRIIIRLQSEIRHWMNQGSNTGATTPMDAAPEWMIDIMDLFLHLAQNQNITYFKRAMNMRDLARILSHNKMLKDAIGRIETELSSTGGERHEAGHLWLLNFLGILYDQAGEVDRSLRTQQKVLRIQEAKLGVCHQETIWTVNELGRIYRHLGQLDESEQMHNRVLGVLAESAGDEIEIAWTKSTLAKTYRKKGRFKDAIQLSQDAIDIYTKAYGEDHPHVLWILNDIGQCYRGLDKLKEAEYVLREAWQKRTTVLGADHPDTLWSANNLGIVLEEMSEYKEALHIQTMALEAQTRFYGSSHRFTFWTQEVIEKLTALDLVEAT